MFNVTYVNTMCVVILCCGMLRKERGRSKDVGVERVTPQEVLCHLCVSASLSYRVPLCLFIYLFVCLLAFIYLFIHLFCFTVFSAQLSPTTHIFYVSSCLVCVCHAECICSRNQKDVDVD